MCVKLFVVLLSTVKLHVVLLSHKIIIMYSFTFCAGKKKKEAHLTFQFECKAFSGLIWQSRALWAGPKRRLQRVYYSCYCYGGEDRITRLLTQNQHTQTSCPW